MWAGSIHLSRAPNALAAHLAAGLHRALRLVEGMLKYLLAEPSMSLKDCVKKGYEDGLR